jgi:transposase-like protein
MTPSCPNPLCPFHRSKALVTKAGLFYRQGEARFIQRFRCKSCGKKFSHATGTLEFRQKKRRVNSRLRDLLCSGVSMRRCARLLGIHRTTVERKVVYLAKKAELSQQAFLAGLTRRVVHLQFDDLITIEHTKMKPLTVSLAVDAVNRFILGARVAPIGAFGHLAEPSRKKYGRRPNRHRQALGELFDKIAPAVALGALVESDEHHAYPPLVKKHLPGRDYRRYPGGRGAIVGQGELKKLKYDPLFMLNHSCAMLRANVNRLIRKTWCTTKRPDMLQRHLDIYVDFHNRRYLGA